MSLREALDNPEKVAEGIQRRRREMWDAIKAENPDLAECIEMTTKKFGKPERVTYEANGRVLDSARLAE